MYTIGIKRRFFGWKKYSVSGYSMEVDVKLKTFDGRDVICQIRPRLVLNMTDGSVILIANIEEKDWKIFPRKARQEWPEVQKSSTEIET